MRRNFGGPWGAPFTAIGPRRICSDTDALVEDDVSIWAAYMPGADELMLCIYAAMAQRRRELISERTRAALAAAKAPGQVLGGEPGYRPAAGPEAALAAATRVSSAGRPGAEPTAWP